LKYYRRPLKRPKIKDKTNNDIDILTKLTPLKKAKTTPTKSILTKSTPTKTTPTKGKGKAKETNIKLDSIIETIILIAAELRVYYKEAY